MKTLKNIIKEVTTLFRKISLCLRKKLLRFWRLCHNFLTRNKQKRRAERKEISKKILEAMNRKEK